MPPPLTERQGQVLDFVRGYFAAHGGPPSLAEIGAGLAIRSTNGVHRLVSALVDKGYLRRAPLQARGITLTDAGAAQSGLSITIAAHASSVDPASLHGGPSLAVDPRILGDADAADCLALRAGDDAMESEGILRGDLMIVERVASKGLRAGRLVAVLYEDLPVARRLETGSPRVVVSTAGSEPTADLIIPPDPRRLVVGHVRALVRFYPA